MNNKNSNTADNFEQVREYFVKYLESHSQRKTPERFTILKEVYSLNHHFDIESLYIHMKNAKYIVSRATLYNTIELLQKCGLVKKHLFGGACAQYEKAYNYTQHDHIVCIDSTDVYEFCDPRIELIKQNLEETFGVKIKSHSLVFYAFKNEEKNSEN
jgi:Fur family ferric uptake transcriptional regulator